MSIFCHIARALLIAPISRILPLVPDPPLPASEWLSYKLAADRLGLENADAVRARARRGEWPKRMRNDTGEAEILVPAAELAQAALRPAKKRETLSLAGAVQAAVAPLEAALARQEIANKVLKAALDVARAELASGQIETAKAEALLERAELRLAEKAEELERETLDRKTLQRQYDALRENLHAAELDAAAESGRADAELAKRDAAEREAGQAQRRLAALEARPKPPWWRPWRR